MAAIKGINNVRLCAYNGAHYNKEDAMTPILFHIAIGNDVYGIRVERRYSTQELLSMGRKILKADTAKMTDGKFTYEIVGMGEVQVI